MALSESATCTVYTNEFQFKNLERGSVLLSSRERLEDDEADIIGLVVKISIELFSITCVLPGTW